MDSACLDALKYLSDFSRVIRMTFDSAPKKYIPLSGEIEFLKLYLNLEKMRFEDKFETDLYIDPALDPETILIPPMIMQPFVENAIKHGLLHKEGAGRLNIKIASSGKDCFLCTIEDNVINLQE